MAMHARQAAASRDVLGALSGVAGSGSHLGELHACGSGPGERRGLGKSFTGVGGSGSGRICGSARVWPDKSKKGF
jgi:hypothetical protein